MRRSAVLLLVLSLTGCDLFGGSPPEPTPIRLTAADRTVLAQSNNFGMRLFARVAADREAAGNDANLMLSPLSASIALTMLLNGSAGETYAQIHRVLGYESGQDIASVDASYSSLRTQLLAADPDVRFAIANAVFYNGPAGRPAPIKAPFLAAMRTEFDASVQGLDFSSPAAPAAINGWASDATNGRIPRVVERISSQDVLFLMNALYFKGEWSTPFDPAVTQPGDFTRANGRTVRVPLMTARLPVRSAMGTGYTAVELPYGRGNFSLVAVLPEAGSVAALARRLAGGQWDEITSRLDAPLDETAYRTDVEVTLPRFTFETEARLEGPLRALGMTAAFDAADLSPMSDAGLSVTGVQQNTFVALDEIGTEAAAVTQVVVGISSIPGFRATRPFVFAIRERTTNTLLFVGQVADPSP